MVLSRSPRRVFLLAILAVAIIIFLTQHLSHYQDDDYRKLDLPFFARPTQIAAPGESSPNTDAAEEKTPKPLIATSSITSQSTASSTAGTVWPTDTKEYIQQVLSWSRPNTENGHWPPYKDYVDKDYDPNRWEAFPRELAFYKGNGMHAVDDNERFDNPYASPLSGPKPYLPYPDYNGPAWQASWKGQFVSCRGPRGLSLNESVDDMVKTYRMPETFPSPFSGSMDAVGLDSDACFERYSRYGPYGFGEDHRNVPGWEKPEKVTWEDVNWGRLQGDCASRNAERFAPEARQPGPRKPSIQYPESIYQPPKESMDTERDNSSTVNEPELDGPPTTQSYKSRTAVLIRTWTGYDYTENDIQAIRALITELSLLSGGEYQVFLLVHVKDRNIKILEDDELYQEVLKTNVPKELREISVLWSESIFPSWYPHVKDWQVYWHQFMCLQFFSKTHPEFDYVWNWETDARYTGQHYHFLEQIAAFARHQPRKLLWEKNKRYYLPDVHGPYGDFVQDTYSTILESSQAGRIPTPIWGPQPQLKSQTPLGPQPPHTQDEDDYEWGVGEEADLITLLPLWDPVDTEWSFRNMIWNFIPGVRPKFTKEQPAAKGFDHPGFRNVKRRVVINTVLRFSKKLLHAMHVENRAGRSMQAEMWPASVSLHHGLKAVYAPHPIWSDREWQHPYSDIVFNADGGVPGAWTEKSDSVYNHDREYNFKSWSWYYSSHFPRRLYRRWLGYKINVHRWGEAELEIDPPDEEKKEGVGRMCLPGMLLHPVKKMSEERVKP